MEFLSYSNSKNDLTEFLSVMYPVGFVGYGIVHQIEGQYKRIEFSNNYFPIKIGSGLWKRIVRVYADKIERERKEIRDFLI